MKYIDICKTDISLFTCRHILSVIFLDIDISASDIYRALSSFLLRIFKLFNGDNLSQNWLKAYEKTVRLCNNIQQPKRNLNRIEWESVKVTLANAHQQLLIHSSS